MRYLTVAEAYRDLEQVSSRLALIERMTALVAQTPAELLPVVCYLGQGQIAPEFAGVDLGLAEKLAIRAVATAAGIEAAQVADRVREAGDLGQAAEQLLAGDGRAAELTVVTVVNTLRQIAAAEGTGSQGRKLELLAGLLARATPLEARYLLRLVTGNLRLGVGTPTILDALAQVYAGGRAQRPVLERAYSICCDLGRVAAALVGGGLAAVSELKVQPGSPVRAMLAQRLSDAAEILAKLGGRCAAEYKYDGVRVQAHRTADGTIELWTRRLEEISAQFPDVVALLAAGLGPREAILEGEVVAYDAAAGELRPFGEVMLRRRKHGIDQAVLDVPVGLFCFELLYADGLDLTRLPYPQRRAALAAAVTLSPRLRLTTATEVDSPAALDAAFAQAVTDGCEGLVCKSTGPGSAYQAGARGWQWIKLKRDYRTELSDTTDLVVVGAFAGRGRRTGVYGAVLLAAYDADADLFRAVTKCGAGFSDADLAALPGKLAPLARADKSPRVDSRQDPDVWFEPGLLLEILSAELTLSPNYTAAWGQIEADSGLAMRFPRFTGRWRDDKSAEDATTTRELIELFLTARRTPVRSSLGLDADFGKRLGYQVGEGLWRLQGNVQLSATGRLLLDVPDVPVPGLGLDHVHVHLGVGGDEVEGVKVGHLGHGDLAGCRLAGGADRAVGQQRVPEGRGDDPGAGARAAHGHADDRGACLPEQPQHREHVLGCPGGADELDHGAPVAQLQVAVSQVLRHAVEPVLRGDDPGRRAVPAGHLVQAVRLDVDVGAPGFVGRAQDGQPFGFRSLVAAALAFRAAGQDQRHC